MHPSERARILQEVAYDAERGAPVVAPGSTIEARALGLIDQARDDDLGRRDTTFAQRRARASAYWRRYARDA